MKIGMVLELKYLIEKIKRICHSYYLIAKSLKGSKGDLQHNMKIERVSEIIHEFYYFQKKGNRTTKLS